MEIRDEVFRDLGLASAAVLVLIYVLMAGWFKSHLTPLVIMPAIPFSLAGILPAHGMPLDEALIDAGAVRFRPMMLTAAAVAAGAGVILFDPIFQGLAIALMAGEIASLLLSRVTVPIVYYLAEQRRRA
jgi:multidrug efflux pump subunit AcrB